MKRSMWKIGFVTCLAALILLGVTWYLLSRSDDGLVGRLVDDRDFRASYIESEFPLGSRREDVASTLDELALPYTYVEDDRTIYAIWKSFRLGNYYEEGIEFQFVFDEDGSLVSAKGDAVFTGP